MNDRTAAGDGWFEDLTPGATEEAVVAIRTGGADHPQDWPAKAVAAGQVADEQAYYDWLHDATVEATRRAVQDRERADDQQLKHSVRAMDDCGRTANELAERITEWAGSRYDIETTGLECARAVADRTPTDALDERLIAMAERTVALADERDELRRVIEQEAPTVAPNLAALAGPVLAARLIALAGSLEALAKKPSGTLQVLGAEEALFAHLRGHAPSPKHGIIYTHEYVRGTRPEDRGSAARALAGKLSIAARIDHYSGELRPDLETALDERIDRIRERADE
ncbi:MAG: NOP5/NOP56 family protein [Halobacteriales archaeon]